MEVFENARSTVDGIFFGTHHLLWERRGRVFFWVQFLFGVGGIGLFGVYGKLHSEYNDTCCYPSGTLTAGTYARGGSCSDGRSLMARNSGGTCAENNSEAIFHMVLLIIGGIMVGVDLVVYWVTGVEYRRLCEEMMTDANMETGEMKRALQIIEFMPSHVLFGSHESGIRRSGYLVSVLRKITTILLFKAIIGMLILYVLQCDWSCYLKFYSEDTIFEMMVEDKGLCSDPLSEIYMLTNGGQMGLFMRYVYMSMAMLCLFGFLVMQVVVRWIGIRVGGVELVLSFRESFLLYLREEEEKNGKQI